MFDCEVVYGLYDICFMPLPPIYVSAGGIMCSSRAVYVILSVSVSVIAVYCDANFTLAWWQRHVCVVFY